MMKQAHLQDTELFKMSWNTGAMKVIYFPDTLQPRDGDLSAVIGGKGQALFKLYNAGLPVPKTVCIGTSGYELFVERNHLREKINLLLHRKELKEMRWEEIWDISLRIQNGTFEEIDNQGFLKNSLS